MSRPGMASALKTVGPVAAIPTLMELNIGHFLVGEAIYIGFAEAIQEMRRRMDVARSENAEGEGRGR